MHHTHLFPLRCLLPMRFPGCGFRENCVFHMYILFFPDVAHKPRAKKASEQVIKYHHFFEIRVVPVGERPRDAYGPCTPPGSLSNPGFFFGSCLCLVGYCGKIFVKHRISKLFIQEAFKIRRKLSGCKNCTSCIEVKVFEKNSEIFPGNILYIGNIAHPPHRDVERHKGIDQ